MKAGQKAAKTTPSQLQSPTARLTLAAQTRPYFVKVADAAWIGYRKPLSSAGAWRISATSDYWLVTIVGFFLVAWLIPAKITVNGVVINVEHLRDLPVRGLGSQ